MLLEGMMDLIIIIIIIIIIMKCVYETRDHILDSYSMDHNSEITSYKHVSCYACLLHYT